MIPALIQILNMQHHEFRRLMAASNFGAYQIKLIDAA